MTKEEEEAASNGVDKSCHLSIDVLDALLASGDDLSDNESDGKKDPELGLTEKESKKAIQKEKEMLAVPLVASARKAPPVVANADEASNKDVGGADASISSTSSQLQADHQPKRPQQAAVGAVSVTPRGQRNQEERGEDTETTRNQEEGEEELDADVCHATNEAFLAEAELVDEEEAGAAQREITRLRQELREAKAQAEQYQQPSVIVAAVPMHHFPERNAVATATINNRQSVEVSEEMSIFMSTRKVNEQEKLDQLRAGRSIKEKIRQLTSNGLYGRDKEISFLKDCLNAHNIMDSQNQEEAQQQLPERKLVLIKGYSGVGKSSLAFTLKETVAQQKGLFVVGKFGNSDLKVNEPYHGVSEVCQGICTAIWDLQTSRSKSRTFLELHGKLSELLDAKDIQLLAKVVPGLKDIMQFYDNDEGRNLDSNTGEEAEDQDHPQAKARLQYLFRCFIRLVASYFAPLVMVVDDLQWADAGSLDLIKAILTDAEESSFLIVGLYRSNEVEDGHGNALDNHILTSTLNELKDTRNSCALQVLELPLGNLDLACIQAMLVDVLSSDAATTQAVELAELCYRRTNGNVYFFTSFLVMLEEERMLEYDFNHNNYRWDIDRIRSDTGATSNLVDLMKRKLRKLPAISCQLLSMAACLGSSFDRSQLEIVWGHWRSNSNEGEEDDSVSSIREQLASVVSEGFLESFDEVESVTYRWIHDSLQEACFALIPKPTSQFVYRIGLVLWQNLSEKELERNIFLVANLLNERQGGSPEDTQDISLSELNLRATKKSFACSAFQSAERYATCGIEKLPAGSWNNHYTLTLELYSYAAEASEILGNYESMQKFCDTVLSQDIPSLDKARVYSVLATQLANSKKHVDAVSLLLKALRSLGVKFPKSTIGVLMSTLGNVLKAKRALKSRTQEEVATTPILHSPLELQQLKLIDKLITYTHICGDDLCGPAIFRSSQITLKHGISEESPTAFAAMATIFTGVLGDLQAGSQYAEYALHLARRLNSDAALARSKFVAANFAFPWTKPLQSCCTVCLESYSEGMRCGDTETATYGIFCYIISSCAAGRPLSHVEADCSIYSKQMKELKRELAYNYTLTVWQMVKNLMGNSKDPTTLEGEVLPDLKKFRKDHHDNPSMLAMSYSYQMRLYAMMGEYEKGAKLFIDHGYDWPVASPGHPLFVDAVFSGGIAAFAMTRRNRKFRKHAMKARATVKGWVRKGNPNVKHYDALFDAEVAALRGKRQKADRFYQSAIAMASRAGFTQDAALANERYGDFMLSVAKDKEEAAYYLKRAVDLYSEWGAKRKVDILQAKYADILPRKGLQQTVEAF